MVLNMMIRQDDVMKIYVVMEEHVNCLEMQNAGK